jgi:hypothetical protein
LSAGPARGCRESAAAAHVTGIPAVPHDPAPAPPPASTLRDARTIAAGGVAPAASELPYAPALQRAFGSPRCARRPALPWSGCRILESRSRRAYQARGPHVLANATDRSGGRQSPSCKTRIPRSDPGGTSR